MSGMADEEQAAAGIMNDGVSKTDNTQTQPGMVVVSGDEYVQHDAPKRRSHVCWYVQQMDGWRASSILELWPNSQKMSCSFWSHSVFLQRMLL
jgi:hypothetical protein